jgi:site-specific DNA recombinase
MNEPARRLQRPDGPNHQHPLSKKGHQMATRNRSKADPADQVLVPAVAYVRCSDDHQIDASIPAQKQAIETWATEHGYTIRRWYVDAGISGWKDDREEFQRLIGDLEKRHDFQAVLCWHTNRFSRFPVLEANHYWYLLDRAGVHLATVLQGRQDWKDIGSWLKASIEQHGDAQHRVKLSADVKRGLRAKAERGIWLGDVPTGYILGDDRKLAIGHPADVALIVRIFRAYLGGASLRSMAHGFNRDGIPSRMGGLWKACTIHRILTNPAYVGIYRRGGIEIANCHPAIIPVADFERAQARLHQRKGATTPHCNGGEFILSGLLRCGRCEGGMTGMDGNKATLKYRCYNNHHKGTCESNMVRQDEVLEALLAGIEQQVGNPRFLERLRERIEQFVKRQDQAPKVNPAVIQRELATLESKLVKAKIRLVEVDVDMLPLVQEQIRALLSEQARLRDALGAVQTPAQRILEDHDQRIGEMLSAFSELRQTFRTADPALVREVLRRRIARVDVWATRDGTGRKHPYRFDHGNVYVIGADGNPGTCLRSLARWSP